MDLDPVRTTGYALAPDGASYRTVYRDARGTQATQLEVREVNTETGRTVRSPLRVPGWSGVLDAPGNRLFVICEGFGPQLGSGPPGKGGPGMRGQPVAAYEVRTGKKLWEREFGPKGGRGP
ncbi:MAG: hypothetical protein JWO38_5382 [Gemmataceae bacterium]|nr:hypothetical protein [Gemmataceae bacterium]